MTSIPTGAGRCVALLDVDSARNLYRLYAAVALTATVAVVAILAAVARATSFRAEPVARLLEACRQSLLPHLGIEHIAVLSGAILGTVVLLRGLRSAARQHRAMRLAVARHPVVGSLDRPMPARIVADRAPAAFCAGLLRPRVYISTGALDALAPDELEAVLAHESHHAARRDPLRVLLARAFSDALFFLPAMRQLTARYSALAELAADEAAVRRSGHAQPLAGAMLTFGERPNGSVVGFSAERVDHLMGTPAAWSLSRAVPIAILVTVGGLFAGALGVLRSTDAAQLNVVLVLLQSCLLIALAAVVPVAFRGLRAQRRARI